MDARLKSLLRLFLIFVAFLSTYKLKAQQVKVLFDATKAEMVTNADWVIDADNHNLGTNSSGNVVLGQGNESNPQRYPTPAQSNVTSSTSETYWDGALSAWAIDCVKRGYEVETLPYNGSITYGDTSNPQDLSNYKVFIVDEPNLAFTSTEKTAILNFVANGGGLFMISDHNGSDRNNSGMDSPHIWNDFLSNNSVQTNPFGITFDYVNISPTTTNTANNPNDSILHGPMGNGTEIQYFNGTTMTLNTTANSSVTGDVFNTGASNTGTTDVLMAHAFYGNGRVAALGDSSPPDDGTGDTNDNLYNGWTQDANGNHEILIMNATIWLATEDSTLQNNTTSSQTITACSNYTWQGTNYTSSGTYMDTIPNMEGGDSIMTLHLTINQPTTSSQTITTCGNYMWEGTNYNTSGTYMDTIANMEGCDSVMTLHLTINNADTSITQNGASLTAMATGATFQWLDCGNGFSVISGATNATYIATSNGSYAVQVTQNTCVDTSGCYIVNVLGIKENNVGNRGLLSIYPNPVKNGDLNCQLSLNQTSDVNVKIYNVLGNRIFSKNLLDQSAGVHSYRFGLTNKLQTGIYFVKVTTKGNSYTLKLVVDKN